jgi:serine/threonine protein kinase
MVNATTEIRELLEKAKSEATFAPIKGHVFERELGEGGMGTVALLYHPEKNEHVAIKLIRPNNIEIKKRFLREMRNNAALQHTNVVGVRDAVAVADTLFFTMEYCEGGSIAQLLQERGLLGAEESVKIIMQCLDGLECAHQIEVPEVELADGSVSSGRCLIHRDIKPANILLAGSKDAPIAKLGDFGLAHVRTLAGLSGLTRTADGAWGTPAFMSRRQATNFKYSGPEVDVWSVAATLYCMLTSEVPRDFRGASEGFSVVRDSEPISILKRNPSLPHELAGVIVEALVEWPNGQFRSAVAFRDALAEVV